MKYNFLLSVDITKYPECFNFLIISSSLLDVLTVIIAIIRPIIENIFANPSIAKSLKFLKINIPDIPPAKNDINNISVINAIIL